jgi:hypothetical protein
MTTLAELAWWVRLVIIVGGAVVAALAIAHFVWRRGLAYAAIGRIEELAKSGTAGFDVVPFYGDANGLALVTRIGAPEGSALLLDTRADVPIPEALPSVRVYPSIFPVSAASETTRRGLYASLPQLRALTDVLAAWRGRLVQITVSPDQVLFLFHTHQLALLERALPALARFAAAVLSAARWYPPARSPVQAGSAFRSAGGDPSGQWFLEAASGRTGPLSLDDVIARMRDGRASWLTRAACGADGPLLPLARQDALAPVRVPVTDDAPSPLPQPPPPRRRTLGLAERWSVVALIWLMMLISGLFAPPNLRRAVLGQASTSWPSVSGKIVNSELVVGGDSDDTNRYSASIRYVYEVRGARHMGDRVLFYYRWRFEGRTNDRGSVEAVVRRYPVGREVPVYYDPRDPSTSVLEPGLVRVELIAGIVALGFVALGALLLLFVALGRLRVALLRRRVAALDG